MAATSIWAAWQITLTNFILTLVMKMMKQLFSNFQPIENFLSG